MTDGLTRRKEIGRAAGRVRLAAKTMRMPFAAAALLAALLAAAAPAASAELVAGGGFESGGFDPAWTHGAANVSGPTNPTWADHLVTLDLPFTGNYSALLGFKYARPQRRRYGFMEQDVAIPALVTGATLAFRYRQQGYDGIDRDPFVVEIRDPAGTVLEELVRASFGEVNYSFKDSGWIGVTADLSAYAGQTIRVHFRQRNGEDNEYETWAFVDDVSVVATRRVDLIAGGDGDDLFGLAGTGAGATFLQSGEGGETVSCLIGVENEGPGADSFTLSVSSPAGWTVVVFDGVAEHALPWTTPPVAPGGILALEARIAIPAGAAVGSYASILDAVSTTDARFVDSATLGVDVVPSSFLADLLVDGDGAGVVDPDGGGGYARTETAGSETIGFAIELRNDGAREDSFAVWWRTDAPLSATVADGGATRTSLFTTAPIPAGGAASYVLAVDVPGGLAGGDYGTVLYARSRSDALVRDAVTAVAGVVAPRLDMVIGGSGAGIVDLTGAGLGGSSTVAGTPGATVVFPVEIRNDGGLVDSFAVSWTGPGGGWTALLDDGAVAHALPWTTPAFLPGERRTLWLRVAIPGGAPYNTELTILDGVSEANPLVRESVTANVTVGSGNETDLLIDGDGDGIYGPAGSGLGGESAQTALPGETVLFLVEAQNEEGTDAFDLTWTAPTGWTVAAGDSTDGLRGVPAGLYLLSVTVPAGCLAGSWDVIVDGAKQDKPYFNDSVRGRVTVIASATGELDLVKSVDLPEAHPGDVITYTIEFTNPGLVDVREIEIADPLPAEVDLIMDAFGPGLDIEWVRGGAPVYLTADPSDADEALYDPATRTLRLVFSRQAPVVLAPGETGRIVYRALIR
ncbi:MAG: DUF11 domain-containing protein [Candidatus Krumholzibacteriota bacterium]|nr:DUF11 domain-containing protein [Candidatus Krumholzibacteriota bacterium]